MSWLSYSSFIPPNLFILIGTAGVVIAWRKKRFGLVLATAAIGCLYLVSIPVVAALLMRSTVAIADATPGLASDTAPGAIIVLSADARRSDIPGEPDTVGPLTLERLAEAVRQQRRLGLPILVSGGPPDDHRASLAALMSNALQEYFGLAAR